ncbi:HET-domain-containing protein [Decorospora gaudefroyi]|uniref:HET-domain-containing protein n=1 Tax=Decorospora gaudefroyi TaxID=184978 RepID=A0A6A5KB10_9PLEO|nr:HET-domain-containing protein [Decorospora gaudefroyi]
MASVYEAHPLNVGSSTNIRVIELVHEDPPNLDNPISCTIHVVSREDAPSYVALSYVWGDEADVHTILLDGKPFTVRRNLWDFLMQWRRHGKKGYLWIDALCIDQSCVGERNHQVAMMGQIYSKAALVISWLGPSAHFERLLQEYRNLVVEHGFDEKLCFKGDPVRWVDYMREIDRAEYWDRLWIVQECVMAQNLELWAGRAKILINLDLLKPIRDGYSLRFQQIFYMRMHYQRRSIADFCSDTLFNKFEKAKCTDPRDRVYGLLAVIHPQELEEFPIVPDYSKSRIALFVELWGRWCKQRDLSYRRDMLPTGDYWLAYNCLKDMLELTNKDEGFRQVAEKCRQEGEELVKREKNRNLEEKKKEILSLMGRKRNPELLLLPASSSPPTD